MIDVIQDIVGAAVHDSGVQVVSISGTFTNSVDNGGANLIPGGVYGFFVRLGPDAKAEAFYESVEKTTVNLVEIDEWRPIVEDIYPLYWGKDKQIGARPYQHLANNPSATGAVRFCAYQSLIDREIACHAVVVWEHAELEKYLQQRFPHLLKTSNVQL